MQSVFFLIAWLGVVNAFAVVRKPVQEILGLEDGSHGKERKY